MEVIESNSEIREYCRIHNILGKSIGFVPTMGALHEGHLSLIRKALKENDCSICSIYVNIRQFSPNEDYQKYPRTLEKDLEMLKCEGCHTVFVPDNKEMYPHEYLIRFEFPGLSDIYEGEKRPGHFSGVCNIVGKLFNLIRPERAYFGLKDFQQLIIIKRFVEEMNAGIEVIACQTIREPDGLAMSSRNAYLSPDERKAASGLYKMLLSVRELAGEIRKVSSLKEKALSFLSSYSLLRLEYLEVVHGKTLGAVSEISEQDDPVILAAVHCGTTRLIDNIQIF